MIPAWVGKAVQGVVDVAKFILGDKPQPKLEETLGELESEKVRRINEEKRRTRKHGTRG